MVLAKMPAMRAFGEGGMRVEFHISSMRLPDCEKGTISC